MTDAPLPASLETLLAHREWVRRVAAALTADEHLAADIEQDVWLAAIERPPRVRGSLRGWLASALRHDLFDRRRADARRVRREVAAARPEAATAADLVESAEAHRRVVNAVMDLAEPYRSTVLLRWYEDLGPAAIAARQGVPVDTVRTRLRRAVQQLRERFDAESGGDRSAWTLALLPLVRHARTARRAAATGATGAIVGGFVMNASTKAALAAAALLLVGGATWWSLRETPAPAPAQVESAAATDASSKPATSAPRRHAADEPNPAATTSAATGAVGAAEAGPSGRPQPDAPKSGDFPDGPAKPGEVAGRVLRFPARTPVAGAVVRLCGGGQSQDVAPFPKPDRATTGRNGVFRIGGFRPGVYVFEASAAGHTSRTFVARLEEGAGYDAEILFGGGGVVEGRVFGAAGPAVGVTIAINRSGVGGGPGLLSCKTGADGSYRFEDLPGGAYTVEVRWDASRERSASVQVAEDKTARLDFLTGGSLVGRVTEAGSSVANAIVRVSRSDGEYRGAQTKTDKDGAYRLDGLEPGKASVGIQILGAEQYAVNVQDVTIAEGESRVDIRIGEGDLAGEISGRAFAKETGGPVHFPEVQISLYLLVERASGVWASEAFAGSAFADAKGEFRVRAVRPGRYRLWVTPNGRPDLASAEVDVEVAYGQRRTGVEIALPNRAPREATPSVSVLTGTLTDGAGRPIGDAIVRAIASDDAKRYRSGHTDGTGRFRIEKLEPGAWRLEVQVLGTEGFSAVIAETTLVAGANALDLRVPAEEIAGRIVAKSSGLPLPYTSVNLTLNAVQPDGTLRFVGAAFPAKDGTFRFRWVLAGTLRILAWPKTAGLKAKEVDVEVAAGRSVRDLEIALDDLPTGKVVFVVRDGEGRPVRDFGVESLRDGRREQGSMDITGTSDGVYESHFEAGRHTITVRDRSETLAATAEVDVREGETTKVEVVLRPAR